MGRINRRKFLGGSAAAAAIPNSLTSAAAEITKSPVELNATMLVGFGVGETRGKFIYNTKTRRAALACRWRYIFVAVKGNLPIKPALHLPLMVLPSITPWNCTLSFIGLVT